MKWLLFERFFFQKNVDFRWAIPDKNSSLNCQIFNFYSYMCVLIYAHSECSVWPWDCGRGNRFPSNSKSAYFYSQFITRFFHQIFVNVLFKYIVFIKHQWRATFDFMAGFIRRHSKWHTIVKFISSFHLSA